MIVSNAAIMFKSNSIPVSENSPKVSVTSCSNDQIAPTPNCHSKRIQI